MPVELTANDLINPIRNASVGERSGTQQIERNALGHEQLDLLRPLAVRHVVAHPLPLFVSFL